MPSGANVSERPDNYLFIEGRWTGKIVPGNAGTPF
jgi:hypothetical protein